MMKVVRKEIETVDVSGLGALLGKEVLLMCLNYNYSGRLVGVNDTCVMLVNASIVYETGDWSAEDWKNAQRLPSGEVYVQIAAMESFFEVDR